MRDLVSAAMRFACEVTIYAAERILEALDAQRPMHDDPLPDGHSDFHPDDTLPDELWATPRHGTLIFDTEPVDRSGLVRGELLRRAAEQWDGIPYGDPRNN